MSINLETQKVDNPSSDINFTNCDNKENQAMLCSPSRYGNFSEIERKLIKNMYEKITKCGLDEIEFVNKSTSEVITHTSYCDNRSCDCEECKKHRLYKYLREHQEQTDAITKLVNNPLGWVFTGWKVPIEQLSREFCREKFKLCNDLLKKYSKTPYTVHMEIKVYRKYDRECNLNKDYGKCFLHFHVVSGGIKNLSEVRNIWGRQIRYEVAISPRNLAFYISKYASKTPVFDDEVLRQYYHCLVYKTQMHKYSIKKKQVEKIESEWLPMDLLRMEVNNSLRKLPYNESSRREWEENRRISRIKKKYGLENYDLNFSI